MTESSCTTNILGTLLWAGIIVCLLLTLLSCRHSTEAPPPPPPDTTTQSFGWTVQTFGDGASSVFYDAAIVNDTLAYAVGGIYKKDSLGNWDADAYNLARWNGKRWELLRVHFPGPCVAVDFPPLLAIWAFSEDNILLSNGGMIARYDGVLTTVDCRVNSLLAGAIQKIYAPNTEEVYLVGRSGSLLRYAAGEWHSLLTGTTMTIQDVWGSRNTSTNRLEVMAVAGDPLSAGDTRKILSISDGNVYNLSEDGVNVALNGTWFIAGSCYYISGGRVYNKTELSQQNWSDALNGQTLDTFYKYAVRGTAQNDVYVTGEFGNLLHYNGESWKNFKSETGLTTGNYYSLATKGELVIAVGEERGLGVIAVGRHFH